MFSLRTDNGKLESSSVEWAPIFAQWLHIIWCYIQQFPTAFEFLPILLEKLLENTYNPNLYSGTLNLWHGMSASCDREAFRNMEFDRHSLEWNCTPEDKLWELLYFKFSQPHVERKLKQRVKRSITEDNFGDILCRFLKDTVSLLHEDAKEEPKALPQQYAAYMDFAISGQSEDRDFWLKVAKESREKVAENEGLLHAHFEVTDAHAKEGRRLQSYNLFKSREDAETSLDTAKQFLKEQGMFKHLVLEATEVIAI